MFEVAHKPRLQALEDQTICPFCLSIRLRMRHRGVVDPHALGGTESSEFVRVKVGAIIRDDAVGDSVSEYQFSDEVGGSA